jgi:hypothetical protein
VARASRNSFSTLAKVGACADVTIGFRERDRPSHLRDDDAYGDDPMLDRPDSSAVWVGAASLEIGETGVSRLRR